MNTNSIRLKTLSVPFTLTLSPEYQGEGKHFDGDARRLIAGNIEPRESPRSLPWADSPQPFGLMDALTDGDC